jgi:ABC-type uncharacterized transport system substrate-binding protein
MKWITYVFIILLTILCFNVEAKKWRIGYYEGGSYHEYNDTMRTLILGLMKVGLIEKKELTLYDFNSPFDMPYCLWLSENMVSDKLSIDLKDCYTARWDNKKREEIREELLNKLKNKEIDLMLSLGTWAGKDLANNEHSVPTIVMSTTDPVKSKIIKSGEDSGFNHITARYDPERYPRQIRMFHRITDFKNVGVVYLDTPDGRIYSALDEFYSISNERNFKVTSCPITIEDDVDITNTECISCFQKLLKEVDAIYVTSLTCEERIINKLVDMFNSHKTLSFALTTSEYVREGILMSISSDAGYISQGTYNADKILNILNGALPRSLNQKFADPIFIAINLDTANKIGFKVPFGIMSIASEIYGDKTSEK